MALQKQPISITFAQGVDTKTDPYQIALGKFTSLVNSVFTVTGRLTKRFGYDKVTTLPNTEQTILTTLNDNLIATGSNLFTYSQDTNAWIDKGKIQPVQLNTLPLIRSNSSQESPDIAISSSGLSCLVYVDGGLSYYHVIDSVTGQQIVSRTALPSTASEPKVFVLGAYFIITFIATVAATPTLQYIAISIANPNMAGVPATISADVKSLTAGYDGYVEFNRLYIAWGASTTVKIAYITKALGLSAITTVTGVSADLMTVTADIPATRIFIAYWDSSSMNGYSAAFTINLAQVMAATQIITTTVISEITSVAKNRVMSVFYEVVNTYSFSTVRTDFIDKLTVTLPVSGTGVGTVSSTTVMLRSVGLASKSFFAADGTIYMMVAYGDQDQDPSTNDSNQPTYFLVDSTGAIYMRLAYSNGGGYAASNVLPSITIINGTYYFPYQITDFLAPVNKGTNLPSGTPVNAIYTQTGINLATFELNDGQQYSSQIAGALHLTGGQLWEFDGVKPVEHGFQVWPENIVITTSTSDGSIGAGTYYYVFTYEWTDNAGNLHRSAPSIPVTVTTTGSTSSNTIEVPTDRLTYKIAPNPIRIVGYRWSVAQQVYYQFTSITSPVLNDTTVDSVEIVDTLADSAILGNVILYTTGGVIEDIAAPASVDSTLFDNRLFLIDAEDQNLLWYSKQVIENVPVEMSDLFTIYVAPTTGAQGSTGPMRAIAPMDDKIIIFKGNALYYINGSGPDNTGANSTYSSATYITGAVGSDNPSSVVLTPMGLMFQSNKGIWLLGRDLSTKYIGAPVEEFNDLRVMSAEVIPNSTQVRFVLPNSTLLMYDYFYDQWAVHTNIKSIYATIWQDKYSYLNTYGQVFQEDTSTFKDGSEPVLMSLVTSWINVAGLQGFERFYFANLLGTYYTPFKLNVEMAYNYNPSAAQATVVTPEGNVGQPWGDEALWGSGAPWGGSDGNVFQARIFPQIQKCQSFQVSIQEIYDPSFGIEAGQGLSLSGLALVVGMKRGFRTQSARKSFG